MRYLAAAALLIVGGKEASADNIKSVLTAAGAEVDEERITLLLKELEGKDIHELLAKGETDLKSVVGVASAGAAAPAGGAAAPAAAKAPEKPKEEEVDALDGGMDMFGGGGGGGKGDY